MGSCVSRPDRCVGGRGRLPGGTRQRRRKTIKRRVSLRNGMDTIDEIRGLDGADRTNPAFQVMKARGSVEESWFDTFSAIESDEEDFCSVQDDAFSFNGSEGEDVLSPSFSRDGNLKVGVFNPNTSLMSSIDQQQKGRKLGQQSSMNVESSKDFVSHEDVSIISANENSAVDNWAMLNNCGILPNNCLPCLVTTTSTAEKRKALSSSPPNSAKKSSLKLSFKWKSGEAHSTSTLFSGKAFLRRPLAGSQVPFCLLEKKMDDSWSETEPNTFRVRGEHYFRDKKKDFAPNNVAYYPFGVDVYLCQQKIDHIARFVELPSLSSSSMFPPLLVVNVQVPLYPATIFQSETDGEGISFVFYFRLSEAFSKELPSHFLENIRKLIDNETERVKSFPMETLVPFRERLKILGRVANMDELPLSNAERKLMHAYNEKPVLSRPQHEFYSGENYFEIDLDMHRFSYISRKGFQAFFDRLKFCVLDFGLTIQGNKPEELPEHMLCCVRLNKIDYINYLQLKMH
ncbi:hypothetical protein Cni_G12933 [Canna indica]|uniref:Protein ENHANCED DISEASE RESISTANCE 2 C-terminal domain-containing protein n=1 Tax=Canna indica TaxID=4628 RepID=A0AAQ3K9D9_9LILI|nr:hypothetical protein Cni_G12933 [Canna indica]